MLRSGAGRPYLRPATQASVWKKLKAKAKKLKKRATKLRSKPLGSMSVRFTNTTNGASNVQNVTFRR